MSPSPSSSAATGPNPPAGRPLQGPGVHRRDTPMDGTWPIERGGTATLSKSGCSWGASGGSPRLPRCLRRLLPKEGIDNSRRRHLPPHAVSICAFRLLMDSLSSARSLPLLLLLLTLPPPLPPPLAGALLRSLAHPQHSACCPSPKRNKKRRVIRGLWRACMTTVAMTAEEERKRTSTCAGDFAPILSGGRRRSVVHL